MCTHATKPGLDVAAQHPAVLAFSRSAAAPMITVSPGQPGGAAQQAALQALHFAAVSDSVASMEAGVPPLYRPGGAVATATVKPTVAGVHARRGLTVLSACMHGCRTTQALACFKWRVWSTRFASCSAWLGVLTIRSSEGGVRRKPV